MRANKMRRIKIKCRKGDIRKSLTLIELERLLEDGLDKSTYALFKVRKLLFFIYYTAIKLFGKDWKKVEDHIGTRTGA